MHGNGKITNQNKGGRPKGSPNKLAAKGRAALDAAYEGAGGVEALTKFAIDHPDKFYPIWAKLIPSSFKHEVPAGAIAPVVTITTSPPKVSSDATNLGKTTKEDFVKAGLSTELSPT